MKRTVRLSLRARVWETRGIYKMSMTKRDRNDELFIVFVVSLQLHYNYINNNDNNIVYRYSVINNNDNNMSEILLSNLLFYI